MIGTGCLYLFFHQNLTLYLFFHLVNYYYETGFVDRLFVVRSLGGGSFIDLHLAAPAQARIHLDGSPARVTLDLQPGIVEYPVSATVSDLVVVVTPLVADVVTPTIEVTGYTRAFESNVIIIATAGDQVVAVEAVAAQGVENRELEHALA